MYDDFEDREEWYQPEQYKPDDYFLQAKEEIRSLYQKDKENIFYIRQLQVKFDKEYFHWVTYNAMESLKKEGFFNSISVQLSTLGTPIQFLIHHSNRYPRRNINELVKIIDEYSQEQITRSCGHRAEDLFALALASHGFLPFQKKVRDYNGRSWTNSNHDLDYIFKESNIAYGAEIKNTLGYIEKEELKIKLDMCKVFNVRPLFILRYAPKTYIEMIRQAGGYAMIFECQIYELSQRDLVERIRNKLGLPVDCPKAIPEGIIIRFNKWHQKSQKL
jgi:hypothetical protein